MERIKIPRKGSPSCALHNAKLAFVGRRIWRVCKAGFGSQSSAEPLGVLWEGFSAGLEAKQGTRNIIQIRPPLPPRIPDFSIWGRLQPQNYLC